MDLSNDVLNIDFGQGAAKIDIEVNIGGQKKYLPTRQARAHHCGTYNSKSYLRGIKCTYIGKRNSPTALVKSAPQL